VQQPDPTLAAFAEESSDSDTEDGDELRKAAVRGLPKAQSLKELRFNSKHTVSDVLLPAPPSTSMLSLSHTYALSLCLSLPLYLCLSVSLYLSLSLFVCLSVSVSLSHSVSRVWRMLNQIQI
jgi:hypothetical protein